jgi:hypothetical protein
LFRVDNRAGVVNMKTLQSHGVTATGESVKADYEEWVQSRYGEWCLRGGPIPPDAALAQEVFVKTQRSATDIKHDIANVGLAIWQVGTWFPLLKLTHIVVINNIKLFIFFFDHQLIR